MRRLFPACVVLGAAAVLLAGLGTALTAEVPPTPTPTEPTAVAKDAPGRDGDPYWVEVAGIRCPKR